MVNMQKPGEIPKKSGEYLEIGVDNSKIRKPRHITIEKNDKKFPPTQKPGRKWKRIGPVNKK